MVNLKKTWVFTLPLSPCVSGMNISQVNEFRPNGFFPGRGWMLSGLETSTGFFTVETFLTKKVKYFFTKTVEMWRPCGAAALRAVLRSRSLFGQLRHRALAQVPAQVPCCKKVTFRTFLKFG